MVLRTSAFRLAIVVAFVAAVMVAPVSASSSVRLSVQSTTLAPRWQEPASFVAGPDGSALLSASLREDVESHPGEFERFETEAAADQFLTTHWAEARRESDSRLVRRGIVGYWRGKTLVLLPSLPGIISSW